MSWRPWSRSGESRNDKFDLSTATGRFFFNQSRKLRGFTRQEMRSILIKKGVILNFLGFLKVIGPIVSVSSVQP